ncbi:PAS-domain containing protein [Roseovarius sp. MMSF_3281]|uniref:PAS-domain containing protein n=1 Tax=Roseovarius sp. MMSF_3281 TaxID=3046694 RepID=UPI00273E9DD0|nr:PAS-domain containing protein [Roseovarius sp. MMSF_3281]
MHAITPIHVLALMGAAAVTALFVVWLSGLLLSRRTRPSADSSDQGTDAYFLFHDDQLADLDIGTPTSIADPPEGVTQWKKMRETLHAIFPGLPDSLAKLPDDTAARFHAQGAARGMILTATRRGPNTRIQLHSEDIITAWQRLTAITESQGQTGQLGALRDAPNAICTADNTGRAIWQNTAWKALPHSVAQQALEGIAPDELSDTKVQRLKEPGSHRCFELHSTPQPGGQSLYITEVTGLVRAENAQRKFVQTLTKTFANLTTGLAVFDRNQELALFNPALLELTSLPAPFLTARPHVMSFFDGLRDRQVMPEPRSYAKWRAHILEMIKSASDGLYQENWSLPSGLTYRITGRPHPDGAVAFLIEDITDEMSIKRRFRAQLDLRQLVMDEMDDAITVFDSRNLLMFCNQRCADLLGIDPDSSFADLSTADIVKAYADTPLGQADWAEIAEALASDKAGLDHKRVLRGRSGQVAECRVRSLSGGVKMLSVKPLNPVTGRPITAEHA